MRNIFFATLIAAVGLAGCDLYTQDDFVPEYVVEAYLVAGASLPEIRLSTTGEFAAPYRFEDNGVTDAEVTVSRLGSDGSVSETYRYIPQRAGVFTPVDTGRVQAEQRYALEVRVPADGTVLRSVTHVPGLFDLVAANADTLDYQGKEQFEARVTRSAYPKRQSIFVFTTVALDTLNYDLTPLYAGFVEDMDRTTKEELVRNYSGLSNESSSSYETDDAGNLLLRLPWAAVAFYGPNEVVMSAVDDNLYDFLRSLDASSPAPGQLENLIDHIEGGRGIFGSRAEAQAKIYVRPQPSP